MLGEEMSERSVLGLDNLALRVVREEAHVLHHRLERSGRAMDAVACSADIAQTELGLLIEHRSPDGAGRRPCRVGRPGHLIPQCGPVGVGRAFENNDRPTGLRVVQDLLRMEWVQYYDLLAADVEDPIVLPARD